MIFLKKHLKIAVICSLAFSMAGCHVLDDMGFRDETVLEPTYPTDIAPPPKTQGSIYQAGFEVSLFEDRVAKHVGDILTVRLEESTQGEKQAKSRMNKTTITDTNQGNGVNSHGAIKPILLGGVVSDLIFNTGSQQDFDGRGETNEFNRLRGTISVTVTKVLSNSYLVVQGESWVTINQGREYIRLSGIVRPVDIGPNNVISSQRIANARISYSGNGQVANASRGGIITQLMYKFFPF